MLLQFIVYSNNPAPLINQTNMPASTTTTMPTTPDATLGKKRKASEIAGQDDAALAKEKQEKKARKAAVSRTSGRAGEQVKIWIEREGDLCLCVALGIHSFC